MGFLMSRRSFMHSRKGRGRPQTNKRNFFNEHSWLLLWKIARQVEDKEVSAEDLLAAGWLRVTRYADKDTLKFSARNIVREMYREKTALQQRPASVFLPPCDSFSYNPKDVLEEKDEFDYLLTGLDARSQRILRLKFINDLDYKEISGLVGVCSERIHQIIKDSLKRIRRRIVERNKE